MKKYIRRVLGLALCMVLILSMATPASAAFISWEDAKGYHTASMSISKTDYEEVKYPSAEEKPHTKGETDKVAYGKGDVVYYYWSYSSNGRVYASYLEALMESLNVVDTKSSTNDAPASVNYATVFSTMESGTYTVGSRFKVHSGTWQVLDDVGAITPTSTYAAVAANGTFEGPDEDAEPVTRVLYKK